MFFGVFVPRSCSSIPKIGIAFFLGDSEINKYAMLSRGNSELHGFVYCWLSSQYFKNGWASAQFSRCKNDSLTVFAECYFRQLNRHALIGGSFGSQSVRPNTQPCNRLIGTFRDRRVVEFSQRLIWLQCAQNWMGSKLNVPILECGLFGIWSKQTYLLDHQK